MARLTDHERRIVFKVLGEFRMEIAARCADGTLKFENGQYLATFKGRLKTIILTKRIPS